MRFRLLTLIAALTFVAVAVIRPFASAQQPASVTNSSHHRYRFVDLGTFGGPDSYVNAAFALGSTHQISEGGVVVGSAATNTPAPTNKAICGGADGLVPYVFHAFEWRDGQVIDLGAIPGIECSEATAINKKGEIVGRSGNGAIDPLVGGEELRAIVWEDGQMMDLGTALGIPTLENLSAMIDFLFSPRMSR